MADDLFGRAHARRADPQSSHRAADAVTPNLRELQARVEAYARRKGQHGFTDAEMSHELEDPGSTYRTRRSELADRNIVLDSGHQRRFGESARMRTVWIHRDFAKDPPPICVPPRPLVKEDRDRARQMADDIGKAIPRLRAYGLVGIADQMADWAEMLKRFAQ